MIETLGSKVASPVQGGPPVPMLEITNIRFQDGNLAQPRYPWLIDYTHAPSWVQFEPGLQIRDDLGGPLTVRFEIDEAAEVEFVSNELEEVRVTSILDPQSSPLPGLVSAVLVEGDPRKCDLVWDQAAADAAGFGQLNTLRLHCRFENPEHDSTPLEEVEGGLYLAILNRKEELNEHTFGNPPGAPVAGTVKMLGFDGIGRPVYDLYHSNENLLAALVLEPAFRCREGQIVSFSLALDLPEGINLMFVTDPPPNDDQVAVNGFLPAGHPFQLYETAVGPFGGHANRNCDLTWTQETGRQYCTTSNPGEARKCYCTRGQISGFGLLAAPDGNLAPPRQMANIDPTVIQPPNCTSSGICITP